MPSGGGYNITAAKPFRSPSGSLAQCVLCADLISQSSCIVYPTGSGGVNAQCILQESQILHSTTGEGSYLKRKLGPNLGNNTIYERGGDRMRFQALPRRLGHSVDHWGGYCGGYCGGFCGESSTNFD